MSRSMVNGIRKASYKAGRENKTHISLQMFSENCVVYKIITRTTIDDVLQHGTKNYICMPGN